MAFEKDFTFSIECKFVHPFNAYEYLQRTANLLFHRHEQISCSLQAYFKPENIESSPYRNRLENPSFPKQLPQLVLRITLN